MAAKRARAIVLLAASAGALVACNLLAGLTEDYAVVGATSDGSMAGSEAGGDEGGMDAASDSPISMMDAKLDAPVEDAPFDGPFCESVDGSAPTFFCTDFEGVLTPPNFGFGPPTRGTGDSGISVEPAVGRYGSAGLDVRTTIAGGSPLAYLAKAIGGNNPCAHNFYEVEFDFKSYAPFGPDYGAIGIMTFVNPVNGIREHGIAVYPTTDQVSRLNPGGPGGNPADDGQVYHRARVTLSRASSAAPFDRTTVIDSKTVDTSTGYYCPDSGSTELRLGVFNFGGGAGTPHASFDNVVIRAD